MYLERKIEVGRRVDSEHTCINYYLASINDLSDNIWNHKEPEIIKIGDLDL